MQQTKVNIYCADCHIDFGIISLPLDMIAGGKYDDYWIFTKTNPKLQEHHIKGRCSVYGVYGEVTANKVWSLILYDGTYTVNPNKDPEFYLHPVRPESR